MIKYKYIWMTTVNLRKQDPFRNLKITDIYNFLSFTHIETPLKTGNDCSGIWQIKVKYIRNKIGTDVCSKMNGC